MYVITGASDGLGLALAKLLVAKGESVMCLSRNDPKVDGIMHITCDLTNEAAINIAAAALIARPEPLQALVNCAGVSSRQPLASLTGAEAARIYTTNAIGPVLLTARLLDRIKKDGADVVNVATAGLKGNPDEAAYSSSKWALRGFTQNLQVEFKDTQCRAISFCPGGMSTAFFDKFDKTLAPHNATWMNPAEVAKLLLAILELPKTIEVSEIVINRRQP
jgi:NAD(P)-dependent dehydrogenase (short-subunit alcohol dehydrogenase family)